MLKGFFFNFGICFRDNVFVNTFIMSGKRNIKL